MTSPDASAHPPWRETQVHEVVDRVRALGPVNGPTIIGVDGRSGSGKSTLAQRFAATAADIAVVHTDDIAWHHSFFDWADLLVEHILEPLRRIGVPLSYRPQAWIDRDRPGAITIPATTNVVVVEGVGACRRSLVHFYDATIWVFANQENAMQRVHARGVDTSEFIDDWMAQENALMRQERPWSHADVIVSGMAGPTESTGERLNVYTTSENPGLPNRLPNNPFTRTVALERDES